MTITKLEIEDRKQIGQALAVHRREEIAKLQTKAKDDAKKLKDMGLKLDYEIAPGRMVSLAYKWDFSSGEATVIFAIRSPKDEFSRRGAREALLKHIENGTHSFNFRSNSFNRSVLQKQFAKSIRKRVATHPQEFPNVMVKEFARMEKLNTDFEKQMTSFKEALREVLGFDFNKRTLH